MTPASLLIGRAFATRLEFSEEPEWEPLRVVSRLARGSDELPSFHEGEFMFMATVRNSRKRRAIHLYKHVDTRRYLNLDDDGRAYIYRPPAPGADDASSGGRYQRYRELRDAIDHVQLWLFEDDPPLFRSFPPDARPPEGPTRAVSKIR